MNSFRSAVSELKTQRLDPYYYDPLFVNHASNIRGRFSDLLHIGETFKVLDGTHDSVVTKESSDDAFNVPFLRSQDIGPGYLRRFDGAFLSREDHTGKCKRSQIRRGDVLINIMATTGDACLFSEFCPNEANANRAVGILRSTVPSLSENRKRYICVLLSSKVGNLELQRNLKGSIQQRLNLEDIADCMLPSPQATVQEYIGEKVRQAEQLRERAQNVEVGFRAAIEALYPDIFGPVRATGKSSRAHISSLDGSLNPGAYDPERLRIREYIGGRGGRLLCSVARVDTPVSDSYQPSDTYVGLDSVSSSTCAIAPSTIATGEVEGAVRVLRAGPVISKLRPYLNKTTYIPSELAGAFGSTELLCVMPFSEVSGWFLYGVLKLESTIRQLNPIATGSTHPRVSRNDVLGLMLPWAENQEELGARLEFAQQSYFTAERLITAAKFMVEALIEGKVADAELREAQEGLERGDVTADRGLLSRLTRKGIDAAGEPPLFPDLDALYGTLEGSSEVTVA
jgi:type I restriction enzyme S subunit